MKKLRRAAFLSMLALVAAAYANAQDDGAAESRNAAASNNLKAVFKTSLASGDAPLVIRFDATASAGVGLEYKWDFGDGTDDEGPLVKHVFMNPGAFNVRLTVKDEHGKEATAVKKISVKGKILPLTALQFQFHCDLTEAAAHPVRLRFRLWQVHFEPGSVLTFKIGGNAFGFMPDEEYDASDPLIVLDANGQYNGEAARADLVRLQLLPGGELRGHIFTDELADNFDQRILPNRAAGIGSTNLTIYALAPDGRYKTYSVVFNYAFSVKRKRTDGDVQDAMIRGQLTHRDPIAEAELTKQERLKALADRLKERAKIIAAMKIARRQAQTSAAQKAPAAKNLSAENCF